MMSSVYSFSSALQWSMFGYSLISLQSNSNGYPPMASIHRTYSILVTDGWTLNFHTSILVIYYIYNFAGLDIFVSAKYSLLKCNHG